MITFIILFIIVLLLGAGFVIANAAGKRKREGMAGRGSVVSQQEQGGGSAPVGRPSGQN